MDSGSARGLALVSGLFIVAQLAGACATGVTDTDIGEDDDGAPSGPTGAGGAASSTGVGRMPTSASQSGSGGAGTTTATTGGMGGATTGTTAATTTTTTATTTTTTATTTTTTGGCTPVDVVSDGGYELGLNTPAWTLTSTNFGTPICDVAGCGTGGGTGPRSGTFWAWFGGEPFYSETATTSQTFVIPNGSMATLEFWLEIPVCDSILDTFEVTMDNTIIYAATGGDAACGNVGYQLKTINVSAYADGGQHTLMFRGDTSALFLSATNFMVDDVSLTACQ